MGSDAAMRSIMEARPVQTMEMLSTEKLKEAWARSEPMNFGDPTLARVEFGLRETFYPLGFPVELSTNSAQVLEAAVESWRGFQKLFDVEPIKFNIGVTEAGSSDCPATPVCRMREHLSSNIADAENFAISDFAQSFSLIWVTRATLEHRSYFRYFFLVSTAMGQIANRYAWGIHAACVELGGTGVLLCGDSGAGKSTLSYACARAGWTYITDDGSYLIDGRDDRLIVGDCGQVRFRPESESVFAELRGRPVMQRAEVGKPSIEFATVAARQFITSSTSHIRHIVFLNRSVHGHELVPFPVEVARLYMLQRASSIPATRRLQAQMFDRLLEGGAFELRYTDLDWAVERLGQLVREGR
jgi:hypothetical protein